MKKGLITILSAFIGLTTFQNRANITAPTGGDKDTTLPKLVRSNPTNNTTNFKLKTIRLEFSEEVQDVSSTDISIKPEYKKIEVKTHKKTVFIFIEDTLKPNVTHRLEINKGIKDYTESNQAKPISIVFSTGEIIDSLFIKGNVKELATNKVNDKTIVKLYENNKELASTIVSADGNYVFNNLKAGKYQVKAFIDANGSKAEDDNEKISISNDFIELTKESKANINLKLIDNQDIKLKILSKQSANKSYNINLNKGIKLVKINNDKISYILSNNNKRVQLFTSEKDSIKTQLTLTDSLNNVLDTLISFKKENATKPKKELANIAIANNLSGKLFAGENIEIKFTTPIKNKENLKVIVKQNTTELQTNNIVKWDNTTNDKIVITNNFNLGDSIKISLKAYNQLNYNGDTIADVNKVFNMATDAEVSILRGNVETTNKQVIIELVDNSNVVIASQVHDNQFNFVNIRPGKYKIRVIVDTNGNKTWDQGSREKNIKPEDIIYYTEEITLKENWEINDIKIKL